MEKIRGNFARNLTEGLAFNNPRTYPSSPPPSAQLRTGAGAHTPSEIEATATAIFPFDDSGKQFVSRTRRGMK
jgi:hypothetical protein